MKAPAYKRTHELMLEITQIDEIKVGGVAKTCGVETQTVNAWCRKPETDDNPTGSGKPNIFDTIKRLIGKVHKYHPGLAHEIGDMLKAYVESLDAESGRGEAYAQGACLLIAKLVKEHADVVAEHARNGTADLDTLLREVQELISVCNQLKACLEELMKAENTISIKAIAHDAVEKSRAANGGRSK